MKRFRILVAASASAHLSRLFAGGVAKYACARSDWDTRFMMGREDDLPVDEIARERFDGAIVAFRDPIDALTTAGIPVVYLWPVPAAADDFAGELPPRLPDDTRHRIVADEVRTGPLVASYFIERGFRNFAFAGGLQSGIWSDIREASFVAALRKAGYTCDVYPYGGRNAHKNFRHSHLEDKRMCEWLRSLPKPVAIFAAYDRRGEQILRCCRQVGLAVPNKVAVVGMDNDASICESCFPPLSSVVQNLAETGFLAARNLDRLMRGWMPPGGTLILRSSASQIVTRASSDIRFDLGSSLVRRAREIIRNPGKPPPSVAELAKRLHVSERLLRLRFRQSLGQSPHEAIAAERLHRARTLLAETNASLAEIASACGFTDASHLSKTFLNKLGITPGRARITQ